MNEHKLGKIAGKSRLGVVCSGRQKAAQCSAKLPKPASKLHLRGKMFHAMKDSTLQPGKMNSHARIIIKKEDIRKLPRRKVVSSIETRSWLVCPTSGYFAGEPIFQSYNSMDDVDSNKERKPLK